MNFSENNSVINEEIHSPTTTTEMNNKTKIHMPPLHVIIIFSEKRAFMGTFGKKKFILPL